MSLQNEISLLVSSDSTQGATKKTSDGSYFEISLGTDGLKIPSNAYNTTLSIVLYALFGIFKPSVPRLISK